MKKLLLGGIVTLMLGAAGLALVGLPLTDIRPDAVTLTPDLESEAEGRALLDAAALAHGVPALLRHQTWTVEMVDTWFGMATWFNPWPDPAQELRMTAQVHSFDSSVELLNGPEQGHTWGLEEGRPWVRAEGVKTELEHAEISFMLPTVHYFVELPQRLTEAEIVRHVGTEIVNGIPFDVVFATWESLEANAEYDQYKIYLDPQSHHIAKLHYTVREAGSFVEGVCHMEDLREVRGYVLPHRMSVTSGVADDPEGDALHVMAVRSFTLSP